MSAATFVGEVAARVAARMLPHRLMRAKRYFSIWEARGYHVTPVHFYEPIPSSAALESHRFDTPSPLRGVEFDVDAAIALLDRFAAAFRSEYSSLPLSSPEAPDGYYVRNPYFGSVDSELLYCFVRELRPRRIFEAGSGFSTLVSLRALERNARDDPGYLCEYEIFDPYPSERTRAAIGDSASLTSHRIQDVPPSTFERLGKNDILFIDSSHVVATGTDVTFLVLEILPLLARGVHVHFHDIFLPLDYPREWVVDLHRFWNEQYLVQAFLAFNPEFEVLWPAHHVHITRPESLERQIPSYHPASDAPSSLWLRR